MHSRYAKRFTGILGAFYLMDLRADWKCNSCNKFKYTCVDCLTKEEYNTYKRYKKRAIRAFDASMELLKYK